MRHGLERNLSLLDAVTIGLGTMLGAGVFVLTGIAAQIAGPAALYSFLLAGGTVLLTALSFAELSTAYPQSGGPYLYVAKAFSPLLAFLTGWSLWIGLALTTTFYAIGFAQYISFLLPIPFTIGALTLAFFIIYINIIGTSFFSQLQNIVVFFLLLLLFIYLTRGWLNIDQTLHYPFFPYGWSPVIRMASVLFVSFLGFEIIATAGEEIKNPQINLPLATIISVISVTAIYCLIIFVTTGIQSHFDLGESSAPIADTAVLIMGPAGGWLMVLAGVLATISSANGSIMASSRIAFAMSRDKLMPKMIGDIHAKLKTPVKSMIFTGFIVIFAISVGNIDWLAEAAGFLHLYPFIFVNLAILQLRKSPSYRPLFKVPFGAIIPLSGALSAFFLLLQIDLSDIMIGFAFMLPGIIYYYLSRFTRLRII